MDRNILLLLLAITAVVVAAIWLNERRIRKARQQGAPLEGFGGWLLLVAISQWALLIGLLCGLLMMLVEGETWNGGHSRSILRIQSILVGVWAAFTLYVNIAMTRKRRSFPRLFRVQLVTTLAMPLVLAGIEVAMARAPAAYLHWQNEVSQLIIPVLGSALWFAYSRKSVRVRNTFVR